MGKGGEVATWVGSGVGLFQPDGGVTFRGAIYLYSTSEQWTRLTVELGPSENEEIGGLDPAVGFLLLQLLTLT